MQALKYAMRSLVDSIVNGNDQDSYYPTSFSSWYSWLANDLLPTAMSNKVRSVCRPTPAAQPFCIVMAPAGRCRQQPPSKQAWPHSQWSRAHHWWHSSSPGGLVEFRIEPLPSLLRSTHSPPPPRPALPRVSAVCPLTAAWSRPTASPALTQPPRHSRGAMET